MYMLHLIQKLRRDFTRNTETPFQPFDLGEAML